MMNFSINILDTGDNFILAHTHKNHEYNEKNHNGYHDGIKLYSLMDITINEINTDLSLKQDEVDFISQNIGRIISYDDSTTNKINIPQKLKEDIQTAVKCYKNKKFWENLQFNNEKSSVEKKLYSRDALTCARLLPTGDKFQDLFGTNKDTKDEYNIIAPLIKNNNSDFTLIVYNEIYNITIVSNSNQIGSPNDILEVFPEFKIVAIYCNKSLNDDAKENLNKFFNLISFPSVEEAKKKNESFKNLYNIIPQSDDDNIFDVFNIKNNEKTKLKDFWIGIIHYLLIKISE